MTCLAAAIGLLPAAISTGIGSQVQKPLALVVVGGMTLAPALILLVLPVLKAQFSRRVGPHDQRHPWSRRWGIAPAIARADVVMRRVIGPMALPRLCMLRFGRSIRPR